MYILYRFLTRITYMVLSVIALFRPKINDFLKGRRAISAYLKQNLNPEKPLIWIHTASLGEYEQGLPVLEILQQQFPEHKFLVSFFSPSGYEVIRKKKVSHQVCYLPQDSLSAVRDFIELSNPKIALFVKYEVWPILFRELERKKIPIVLFSAIFKKNQVYFKWYGKLLRQTLSKTDHIFVQDETSANLLKSIGIGTVSISGDTRLDRVSKILERDNTLGFMERFKKKRLCVVAGSTWPEDESLLLPYISSHPEDDLCFVIAPHTLKESHLTEIENTLKVSSIRYSLISEETLLNSKVLILDTIGLLTRVYSYADLAYVGGGFATGLHNTLEPAVFGIPVIIGPDYMKFNEARILTKLGGILSVEDAEAFEKTFNRLIQDTELRRTTGAINTKYIEKNKGGSIQIANYLRTLLE